MKQSSGSDTALERSALIVATLTVLLAACSPSGRTAEIAKYDDGPLAGMGFPFSESARAGDLLFLAGQIGEDAEGNLVPGGIEAEAEQVMLNIEAALARRGLTAHLLF